MKSTPIISSHCDHVDYVLLQDRYSVPPPLHRYNSMPNATAAAGNVYGFPRSGPRNSIGSLSSGSAAVQSPPGYDNALPPPTGNGGMNGGGYYSTAAVGHGMSNGRSTPCGILSQSGHFKFPSIGHGQVNDLCKFKFASNLKYVVHYCIDLGTFLVRSNYVSTNNF